MNKELTPLEAFRIMVKDNDLKLPYKNTIIAIELSLKALDIIKDEFEITFNDKEQTINFQSVEYPYPHISFSLTRTIKDKEKYDLLKEALCE